MKELSGKLNNIKEKGEEVGEKFREQTAGYITAALGLVAGLAWSDAVKGLIEHLFPISKDTVLVRFIYAIIITMFVIIVSRWLISALRGNKEKDK
jgi:hypothetical protein